MNKSLYLFLLILSTLIYSQSNSVKVLSEEGTVLSSCNSVQEAYDSIPNFMNQSYLIELTENYNAASELFPIKFYYKHGSSSRNQIIVRPTLNAKNVILSAHLNGAVIIIDSCNFIVIDGRPAGTGSESELKIENTDTSLYSHTIDIINSSSNIILKYISLENAISSSFDLQTRNINIGESQGTGNTDINIEHCVISGGNIGVCSFGNADIPNSNISVSHCMIKNFAFAGVWIAPATRKMIIQNCTIYQEYPLNIKNPTGILINGMEDAIYTIRKNKILDLLSSYEDGITARGINVNGRNNSVITIENNIISMCSFYEKNTENIYGICLQGSANYNMNIWFNTIYIGGIHTGGFADSIVSACIIKKNTSETGYYNQINNICVNTRTGGVNGCQHLAFALQSISDKSDIDYNTYFSFKGAGSKTCCWMFNNYNNIETYKVAAFPNEKFANFHSPDFISSSDLHLNNESVGDIALTGIPISGINEDFDGQARNTLYPYRGADETETALPVELTSFSASVENSNVILRWFVASELNNSGFYIERTSKEENWKVLSFIKGRGTINSSYEYSYTDQGLPYGIYKYRLKQQDFSGVKKYYFLKGIVEITQPVYNLEQNFPNPFNPFTQIKYTLTKEARISLKVYNILGNEVAVLYEGKKDAGSYEVNFSSQNLSSGVYMYVLKAGDYTETKKMIVVK